MCRTILSGAQCSMEFQWGDVMGDGSDMLGAVLRMERTSIHDGQGLRTVLFLKGCSLRCRWCSTPESQKYQPEKGYAGSRCIGCGICVSSCPEGALSLMEGTGMEKAGKEGVGQVLSDPVRCINCFTCVTKCPHRVWKKYGSMMSVREVVREISKDEIFFFHSSGGVTISGGEPLMQADFSREVLKICRERGIDTAMETSFYAPWEQIEKVLPWLNTLFVDLKLMDREMHREWTGVDNTLILDNIKKADQSPFSLEIIVRVPMIPEINDFDENLRSTGEFCRSLTKLKEMELLPYHRLGLETYRNLGIDYQLPDLVPPTRDQILKRAGFLKKHHPNLKVKVGGGFV